MTETNLPFRCIQCSNLPVRRLYITYATVDNTAPIDCLRCGEELDVYQTFQFEVVLVDLLLFRSRVFRHLLRNRGQGGEKEREQERRRSMLSLGAVVISLDAYVRCKAAGQADGLNAFQFFGTTLLYVVMETLSLHFCIAISAWALVVLLSKRRDMKSLTLLPLTLFYAFIPVLFLLVISSLIWADEYALSLPSTIAALVAPLEAPDAFAVEQQHSTFGLALAWLASFSRENLRSKVSQVGNVTGWANDAVHCWMYPNGGRCWSS
ncbi:hypothetical protein RQP46_000922 [Phenoliferia psychrophenolica]